MGEMLIKIIKHGLTVIAAVPGHEENWDVIASLVWLQVLGAGEHQILSLHDLDMEESSINR
jgi:hypothetical protein